MNIIVVLAAVVSSVLAVVAIGLLIVFYRMITTAAWETGAASRSLSTNVDRMEKLSDRFILNSLQLVRDFLVDFISQTYRKDAPVERHGPFGEDIESAIREIVGRPGITTFRDVHFILRDRFSEQEIRDALLRAKANGVVTWDGEETNLDYAMPVTLVVKKGGSL